MTFYKTALSLALLAASAGASANILGAGVNNANPAEDNAELLLIVFSRSAEASYVLDTGISIANFKANGSSAAGYSFSRSVTSTFTGSVLASATDLEWAVAVFDTYNATDPLQAGDLQFLTTVRAQSNFSAATPGLTGAGLSATVPWQTFTGTVNGGFGNHQTVANGDSLNVKADGAAYVLDPFAPGTNLSGNFAYSQYNPVGTASSFHYMTACDLPDGSCFFDGSLNVQVRTFGNASGEGKFSFNGSTLSYNLAAVPEPGTYALWLAGLAAVGFLVRRRHAG